MKAGIISLGCPKNQIDAEIMLGQLTDAGYSITGDKDEADILIVNTCGFIRQALEESIEAVFEAISKKSGKCRLVVVTGCMVLRYGEKVLKEMPEVDAAVSGCDAGSITEIIGHILAKEGRYFQGDGDKISFLNGKRILTGAKGSAYIKIAEGCDNHCSYCTIPSIKGRFRSRPLEDIIAEAQRIELENVKEAILVAQDTTNYGRDLYGKQSLNILLEKMSGIKGIEWIRLMYCYPDKIDNDLIKAIKTHDKICRYLDIPIQHASDRILNLMGRKGTRKSIISLINKLREEIPGVIIRTTLITGFPTETKQDFEETARFIKEARPDRLGVFTYSAEEGTVAFGLKPKVRWNTAKSRHDELMLIQQEIMFGNNQNRIGKVYKVLTEGIDDDGIFYYGRSYAEAPSIDGAIYFTADRPLKAGCFTKVRILSTEGYDLVGEAIDEPAE